MAAKMPENQNWWIQWAYSLRRETSVQESPRRAVAGRPVPSCLGCHHLQPLLLRLRPGRGRKSKGIAHDCVCNRLGFPIGRFGRSRFGGAFSQRVCRIIPPLRAVQFEWVSCEFLLRCPVTVTRLWRHPSGIPRLRKDSSIHPGKARKSQRMRHHE